MSIFTLAGVPIGIFPIEIFKALSDQEHCKPGPAVRSPVTSGSFGVAGGGTSLVSWSPVAKVRLGKQRNDGTEWWDGSMTKVKQRWARDKVSLLRIL